MKKVLFASLLGLLSTTLAAHSASAQSTALLEPKHLDAKGNSATGSFIPETELNAGALPLNAVSSRAIRTFKDYFKNVTDQQWYHADGNKYLTIFKSNDGRVSRALVDRTGYLYYGICYGKEQSLTKDQRRIILSKYFDYKIGHVSEIISNGPRTWVVNLEDNDNIIVARLTEDGNLDQLEYYHKHLPVKKGRNKDRNTLIKH